jgi:hypothetical protein
MSVAAISSSVSVGAARYVGLDDVAPPRTPTPPRDQGACGPVVISSRRAQGQPDQRPVAQAGKEWLALRTSGPAEINPRR